jgi:hypothetical protein
VVHDALTLERGGLCGSDIHAPVDVHAVEGEYLHGEEDGKFECDGGLSARGGSDQEKDFAHGRRLERSF